MVLRICDRRRRRSLGGRAGGSTRAATDNLDEEDSQEANPCEPYAWDGTVKDLINAAAHVAGCLIGPSPPAA